jgi:hypothetical protein
LNDLRPELLFEGILFGIGQADSEESDQLGLAFGFESLDQLFQHIVELLFDVESELLIPLEVVDILIELSISCDHETCLLISHMFFIFLCVPLFFKVEVVSDFAFDSFASLVL